jgi:hypothetical protein
MTDAKHVDSLEWTAIGQVVERLQASYPSLEPDAITTVVHRNHAKFDGSRVRDFVPLFVERGSRRELSLLQT